MTVMQINRKKNPIRPCRVCGKPGQSYTETGKTGIVYLLCPACKCEHEQYGATLVKI